MRSAADRNTSADDVAAVAAHPEDDAAAAPEASTEAGGGLGDPGDPPAVTGAVLADELEAAVLASGQSLHAFIAPIASGTSGTTYLRQLRQAKAPRPQTIAKIRRLIAGELHLPAAFNGRRNPECGNAIQRRRARAAIDEARAQEAGQRLASELGKALRQPGETLAASVAREATEEGALRTIARVAGGGVEPIDLRRIAHYPKARKFEPLPPDTWAALKRLADEQGEAPMALLPRIVERGIESFRSAS